MNEVKHIQPDPISAIFGSDCPSLSGRSTLTYLVGKHEAEGTLYLCIARNSGGGMWCKDWATVSAIEAIVVGAKELTAKSFHGLHPGKSINTGGFVLAALRDLGLLQPSEPNSRHHEHVPMTSVEEAVTGRLKVGKDGSEANPSPKARRKGKEAN